MKPKVSVTLSEARFELLRREAKKQHRSVTNLVETFIVKYVETHGTPDMIAKLNRDLEHVSNPR